MKTKLVAKPTSLNTLPRKTKFWLPLLEAKQSATIASTTPSTVGASSGKQRDLLDLTALDSIFKEEPHAIRRILHLFRLVNDVDVELLNRAVDQGDLSSATHMAHRIKGACGSIGAIALATVCASIEQAGRAGDGARIEGFLKDFRSQLEQLNAYLDAQG